MRRISIIGLAALCMLAIAAVGASGASGAETTGWTCVSGKNEGAKVFKDKDCTEEGTSLGFGHVKWTEAKTSAQLTNNVNSILSFTAGGALIEFESSELECLSCTLENKGTTGSMEVAGSGGQIKYKNVIVKNQTAKCVVTGGSITTKPLVVRTIATNEVLIEPVTPAVMAEFTIAAVSGQTCNSAGSYTIKGDLKGTTNGSILTVAVPRTSKTLTVGALGAGLSGKATVDGKATADTGFTPLALT